MAPCQICGLPDRICIARPCQYSFKKHTSIDEARKEARDKYEQGLRKLTDEELFLVSGRVGSWRLKEVFLEYDRRKRYGPPKVKTLWERL
jgi:hypothetical protein